MARSATVELLVVGEVADQDPALILADDARGEVGADDRRGQWSAVAVSAGPEQESADGGASGGTVGEPGFQLVLGTGGQGGVAVWSRSSRRTRLRISVRTVSARPWVTCCPMGRHRRLRRGCQFVWLRRTLRSSADETRAMVLVNLRSGLASCSSRAGRNPAATSAARRYSTVGAVAKRSRTS